MKFILLLSPTVLAFSPASIRQHQRQQNVLYGYLDDLNKGVVAPPDDSPPQDTSKEATNMSKENLDRYGPGDFSQFVDFNEFDGGDGQMGVAGDGSQGLEKEWEKSMEMGKSQTMSAKNAWGKTTGYAESLIDQGMEATRAQQMENWRNQREVQASRDAHRYLTDEFDNKTDEDWRNLSTYGGEQTDSTANLDQEFGAVVPGDVITGLIEFESRINQAQIFEFELKNPFMGFSDFRARFTGVPNPVEWSVTPTEGSLNGRGSPTQFLVKYRPQQPGVSGGYLVVETDEEKWTFELRGSGSM